jgi:bifunctional non-homologous end joining protein LigD
MARQHNTVHLAGTVITNPGKLFWPDDGLTKLDLARYYCRIASAILPWMKGRALVMERCPDGVRRGCFFQKQAPRHLAQELPTVRLAAPTAGRDVDYVLGGKRKTLLTLVNLGCIAMHVMNSRSDQPKLPDWLAFDLDPAGGFAEAVGAARLLKDCLAEHGLEAFVKLSGARGLHVLVPLRRGASQEAVRAYASRIARELAGRHPDLLTTEVRKANRRAPVYLDVQRNARGQTIVPPYSVRWRPRAPVSLPLSWDELHPQLDPVSFNVRTAERHMAARLPWEGFFRKRQTLPRG